MGGQSEVFTVSRRAGGSLLISPRSAPPLLSAASWSWGGGHWPARGSEDPSKGQEGRWR